MKLIIFGAPGAGKGTVANIISKEHNLNHISTGELIREEIYKETEIGKKFKDYANKGLLAPDSLVIDLLKKNLPEDKFILDGFPRTEDQATELNKIIKIEKVIVLDVKKKEIVDRLTKRRQCPQCSKIYGRDVPPLEENKCDICHMELIQREDDKEEVISKRFDIYKKETKPVLELYKKEIIKINANQKISKVVEDIRKVL